MLNTHYRSCRTSIDPIPITVLVSILLVYVTKHTHLCGLFMKAIPSLTGHIGYTYMEIILLRYEYDQQATLSIFTFEEIFVL